MLEPVDARQLFSQLRLKAVIKKLAALLGPAVVFRPVKLTLSIAMLLAFAAPNINISKNDATKPSRNIFRMLAVWVAWCKHDFISKYGLNKFFIVKFFRNWSVI